MFIHSVIQQMSVYYEPGIVLLCWEYSNQQDNLGPVLNEYTLWQLFIQHLLFKCLLCIWYYLKPKLSSGSSPSGKFSRTVTTLWFKKKDSDSGKWCWQADEEAVLSREMAFDLGSEDRSPVGAQVLDDFGAVSEGISRWWMSWRQLPSLLECFLTPQSRPHPQPMLPSQPWDSMASSSVPLHLNISQNLEEGHLLVVW